MSDSAASRALAGWASTPGGAHRATSENAGEPPPTGQSKPLRATRRDLDGRQRHDAVWPRVVTAAGAPIKLLERAFAADLAHLHPDSDVAARIYGRLGFMEVAGFDIYVDLG
jgi:hypothetical protein